MTTTPIFDALMEGQMTIDEVPIPRRPLSYAARARAGDPETSHEAAASVEGISDTQQRLLTLLTAYPTGLTDEQMYHRWSESKDSVLPPISPSGLRSRRSELVKRGLVKDSGRRGTTLAGRSTIIWQRA